MSQTREKPDLKEMSVRRGPILAACDIAMSFGATHAIRRVDLSLYRGETHALVGRNGTGKSTLVKILLGALQPDKGRIELDGKPVVLRSVKHAIARGIYPIYQNMSQFPDMTVRENLAAFSIATARGIFVRKAIPADKVLRGWLDEVGLSVSLDMFCRDLSTGEMQLLEVARAIGQDAKILVLDEPTAALTQADTEVLLMAVRKLRDRNAAVLLISHDLDEITAVADRITVIRDGVCAISGAPMHKISASEVVRAMVGSAVAPVTAIVPHGRQIVASIVDLALHKSAKPISFTVARGEIVGLIGIVGSGANRLAEIIAGAAEPFKGTVLIDGVAVTPLSRREAVARGVGFVPTDRDRDGIFTVLGAIPNTSAASIDHISRWGLMRKGYERARVSNILKRVGLVPFCLEHEASVFSGGNQQKLIVARNLLIGGLKLLVMSEPTRGVDVAARGAVHEIILEASAAGTAVIIASSDVDELLGICHRVLIVQDETVIGEFHRGAERQRIIGALTDAAA